MAIKYSGAQTTFDTRRAVFGESEIVVPAELAELHEKYSGQDGRTWIAGLPALATAYLDRWQLAIDGPGGIWSCCADRPSWAARWFEGSAQAAAGGR
jgi:hypothetical protein